MSFTASPTRPTGHAESPSPPPGQPVPLEFASWGFSQADGPIVKLPVTPSTPPASKYRGRAVQPKHAAPEVSGLRQFSRVSERASTAPSPAVAPSASMRQRRLMTPLQAHLAVADSYLSHHTLPGSPLVAAPSSPPRQHQSGPPPPWAPVVLEVPLQPAGVAVELSNGDGRGAAVPHENPYTENPPSTPSGVARPQLNLRLPEDTVNASDTREYVQELYARLNSVRPESPSRRAGSPPPHQGHSKSHGQKHGEGHGQATLLEQDDEPQYAQQPPTR